jgi:hypothetical protein
MAGEKYLVWTFWVFGLGSRGLKQDRPRHGVDEYRNGDAFPQIQDIESTLGRLLVPLSQFCSTQFSQTWLRTVNFVFILNDR